MLQLPLWQGWEKIKKEGKEIVTCSKNSRPIAHHIGAVWGRPCSYSHILEGPWSGSGPSLGLFGSLIATRSSNRDTALHVHTGLVFRRIHRHTRTQAATSVVNRNRDITLAVNCGSLRGTLRPTVDCLSKWLNYRPFYCEMIEGGI